MLQVINYQVLFEESSQKELDKFLDYYHIISENSCGDLLAEYERVIGVLACNPNLYTVRKYKFRRVNLRKFPIMFIYLVNESSKEVKIISAHHQKINPNKIYKIKQLK